MKFFKTIKDSIYNPEFYRTIPLRSLGEAMKQYWKLGLALSAIATVCAAFFFLPSFIQMLKTFGDIAVREYPESLVITVAEGTAKTNLKSEPYFIKVPTEFTGLKLDTTPAEYLFVIDTRSPGDIKTFLGYKAFGMLTKDSLLLYKDHGAVSTQPLRAFASTTIDKAFVLGLVDKIPTLIHTFSPGLVILAFIVVLITYASVLLYLLLLAVLVWGIARLKGAGYTYGASYRTVLYAVTLPLILNFMLLALGMPVPWLFTLLVLLIASINIRRQSNIIPTV